MLSLQVAGHGSKDPERGVLQGHPCSCPPLWQQDDLSRKKSDVKLAGGECPHNSPTHPQRRERELLSRSRSFDVTSEDAHQDFTSDPSPREKSPVFKFHTHPRSLPLRSRSSPPPPRNCSAEQPLSDSVDMSPSLTCIQITSCDIVSNTSTSPPNSSSLAFQNSTSALSRNSTGLSSDPHEGLFQPLNDPCGVDTVDLPLNAGWRRNDASTYKNCTRSFDRHRRVYACDRCRDLNGFVLKPVQSGVRGDCETRFYNEIWAEFSESVHIAHRREHPLRQFLPMYFGNVRLQGDGGTCRMYLLVGDNLL